MKMSEKRKKPRWSGVEGVDTKERDVIKPISASRLENNRLTRREDNGFFSSFI